MLLGIPTECIWALGTSAELELLVLELELLGIESLTEPKLFHDVYDYEAELELVLLLATSAELAILVLELELLENESLPEPVLFHNVYDAVLEPVSLLLRTLLAPSGFSSY